MKEFEITFKEFIEKFRTMLIQDNSNIVLNYRVYPSIGYEFYIPFHNCIYHLIITEKDLKEFYNTDKFDRDAMFRIFKEELIDKSNAVCIK